MSVMKIDVESKLVIIEPDGAQGMKLGLQFFSKRQFVEFDEAVGKLPAEARKNISDLSKVARALGIGIVKP